MNHIQTPINISSIQHDIGSPNKFNKTRKNNVVTIGLTFMLKLNIFNI